MNPLDRCLPTNLSRCTLNISEHNCECEVARGEGDALAAHRGRAAEGTWQGAAGKNHKTQAAHASGPWPNFIIRNPWPADVCKCWGFWV